MNTLLKARLVTVVARSRPFENVLVSSGVEESARLALLAGSEREALRSPRLLGECWPSR